MRSPSMIVASSGSPFGAMQPPTIVITSGKSSFVVLETGLAVNFMAVFFSFSVVSARMIGGWITGTRAM